MYIKHKNKGTQEYYLKVYKANWSISNIMTIGVKVDTPATACSCAWIEADHLFLGIPIKGNTISSKGQHHFL